MTEECEKKRRMKVKVRRVITFFISFFKIMTFACLVYSSAVLYLIGHKTTAGIVFGSLCFYLLFSQIDALQRRITK